jgi:phage terminase large subunit-like protein
VSHKADPVLRQHALNAGIKPARDDSTLRIVKQTHAKKVDALVAASMACQRILYLIV